MPTRSTSRSRPRPRAGLAACAAAAAILAGPAGPAAAQDAARGKALYETHCLSCHYERIHKRDPARSLVRSMAQLRAEVARRAGQTGRRFSIEDADDVAEYLNQSHYRFGLGPRSALDYKLRRAGEGAAVAVPAYSPR